MSRMFYRFFWGLGIFFWFFLILPVEGQENFYREEVSASIGASAPDVVLVGATVQLTGSATGVVAGESFFRWRLAKKPLGSKATLTTPSPSQPSFVADLKGLYVAELVVGDGDKVSEPTYHVVSAVMPSGTSITKKKVSPPSLCALSSGFIGCQEVTHFFTATAGEYQLNITNSLAKEVIFRLNSRKMRVLLDFGSTGKTSLPVTLLGGQNQLMVDVRGGSSSFVSVEIVPKSLPSNLGSSPQVQNISLTASGSTKATGQVLTPVGSQFSLLNTAREGVASLVGSRFDYTAFPSFKGSERFYLLTSTGSDPLRGSVFRLDVDVTYNQAPRVYGWHDKL